MFKSLGSNLAMVLILADLYHSIARTFLGLCRL